MENKLDLLYTAALNKVNETSQQRQRYEEEIAWLEEESKAIAETIEKALEDQDFATYRKAVEDQAMNNFNIAANRKLISNMGEMQPENFADVWGAFSAEYEAEFCKCMKAYREARKALYKQYMELFEMQKKACALRRAIAVACKLKLYVWNSDADF